MKFYTSFFLPIGHCSTDIFHVLSQYSQTAFPVSTLFLSLTSGCAVAFWHCSWQDLTRNQKLILIEYTAIELIGEINEHKSVQLS